ncbi:S8 family serine peptidase [bacterium]|nr:S8 family serine peptidase [bacterium]
MMKRNHPSISIFSKTLFFILLFAFLPIVRPAQFPTQILSEDQVITRGRISLRSFTPSAVQGELIVKFQDSIKACVHCLIKNHRSFRSATSADGDSLDEFVERYEVTSMRPVFRTEVEEDQLFDSSTEISTEVLKRYHQQRFEIATAKFPKRTLRRPKIANLPSLHHIYLFSFGVQERIGAAAAELSKSPHVEYVQVNYLNQADFRPNDPYYKSSGSWGQNYDDLWSLKQDRMDLAPAWDRTRGQGVVVAVVDTGLDYAHKDITANVWNNPAEIAGNNLDDDANGFIDDHRGWDFVSCEQLGGLSCRAPKLPDNDPFDDHLHGTHVSGTIAAEGHNRFGIIGVAPEAKIMPVRGLNKLGQGTEVELAAAIEYAAMNGADVINNSWGCGFCPSLPLIEDAIKAAHALGAVVVFSAGNGSRNLRIKSPQNLHDPKPIVVAATNELDQPTSFTDFGATVDVAAPGGGSGESGKSPVQNILSLKTSRCNACGSRSVRQVGTDFLRLAGTSMSAPHASGLAALLLSNRPELTTEEVRQILRSSADDLEGPGFDLHTGAGRLNAPHALSLASPLEVKIEKPLHLTLTSSSKITIRGTASGAGFQEYQLFYQLGDGKWVPIAQPVSHSVQNGVLGKLKLSSLPLGWKTLRLVATGLDGKKFEDLIDIGNQLHWKSINSPAPPFNSAPDISGDQIVFLWDVGDDYTPTIFHYDLATKELRPIVTGVVTVGWTRISGNIVVWRNTRPRWPGRSAVFTTVPTIAPQENVSQEKSMKIHRFPSSTAYLNWLPRFPEAGSPGLN